MRNYANETRHARRSPIRLTKAVGFSLPLFVGLVTGPLVRAKAQGQSAAPSPSSAATLPTGVRPTFEAASIKPTDEPRKPSRFQAGGRFVAPSVPARILIGLAYSLPFSAGHGGMIGGPDWLDSQRYDVEARAEGNPPQDQMVLMLQSLLADRFKLSVHWETRQLPVYALVLAKAGRMGPQLVPHATSDSSCREVDVPIQVPLQAVPSNTKPSCAGGFVMSPGHIGAVSTMADLAKAMSWFGQIDRAVVDRTGLSGTFNITLDYAPSLPGAPADADATDSSFPSTIFTALNEQLGLKLESETGPVQVLVIDHMEKPSEN